MSMIYSVRSCVQMLDWVMDSLLTYGQQGSRENIHGAGK